MFRLDCSMREGCFVCKLNNLILSDLNFVRIKFDILVHAKNQAYKVNIITLGLQLLKFFMQPLSMKICNIVLY